MRIVRLVHAWAGIVLALFMAAIAFSGALSAMRPEYTRLRTPEARAPAPSASTYGFALNAFEAARPGELSSVVFSPAKLGVHKVSIRGNRVAFITRDGKVVREWWVGTKLEEKVLGFHHTFLLGGPGRLLASLFGLIAIGLIITGLILILPQLHIISLRLWPRSLARRDLVSAHRNLALVLSVLLLLQVPSGVWVNLTNEINLLTKPAPDPAPPRTPPPPPGAYADWHKILAAAQEGRPGALIREATAPKRPDGPYLVQIGFRGDWIPSGSKVVFVDWDGKVLGDRSVHSSSWQRRSHDLLIAWHTGNIGPEWMRYVVAVVGLGLGVLSLFGAAGYAQYLTRGSRRRTT